MSAFVDLGALRTVFLAWALLTFVALLTGGGLVVLALPTPWSRFWRRLASFDLDFERVP